MQGEGRASEVPGALPFIYSIEFISFEGEREHLLFILLYKGLSNFNHLLRDLERRFGPIGGCSRIFALKAAG